MSVFSTVPFISVEGGLIYETLPAEEWRDKLQALGLEVDR
uniref:MobA n=1 Tax=Aeromonas salmonicida TaxID=645 RepID=A0A0S1GND0_AERSA|nr:MobA [Aeromonas salmonicida]